METKPFVSTVNKLESKWHTPLSPTVEEATACDLCTSIVKVFAAREFVSMTLEVVPAATCPPVIVMLPEDGTTGFVPGAVNVSTVTCVTPLAPATKEIQTA